MWGLPEKKNNWTNYFLRLIFFWIRLVCCTFVALGYVGSSLSINDVLICKSSLKSHRGLCIFSALSDIWSGTVFWEISALGNHFSLSGSNHSTVLTRHSFTNILLNDVSVLSISSLTTKLVCIVLLQLQFYERLFSCAQRLRTMLSFSCNSSG